ncbi:MAG TPA: ATP synthase F0 subunit B [Pyrinomonadaceae bacterium]|jgi:F0F1-type ATP synthase membrane subunit b/b'|nr:ATP synthase F0 subunit B [Pyrinomonadaceae bacterium]
MLLLISGEWMEWFNYPGLEIWKFLNLAIFTSIAIYILRRPISAALAARREAIRQELVTAQTEREQALARVSEADDLLSRIDEHVAAIRKQALNEAKTEKGRLAAAAETEIEKLKQQGQREMEVAGKLARKELRQFLAQRSVELAQATVRSQMRPEDDTLLIKDNIADLRRTTV